MHFLALHQGSDEERWRYASGYRKTNQWEDIISSVYGIYWFSTYWHCNEDWGNAIPKLVETTYVVIHERCPETHAKPKLVLAALVGPKVPRVVEERERKWDAEIERVVRLEILGDGLLVEKWHQGVWAV